MTARVQLLAMTSTRFVLFMTMFIACGKREHVATSAFASDGAIHGAAIDLEGNMSGEPATDSSCTYRVDGNELAFDVEITRASGGCAHSGTPSMLKVTCTGPRLAPGHYVVREDGFADVAHLALEATVGPDGTGELTRTPADPPR